jgi:hypothetical protein
MNLTPEEKQAIMREDWKIKKRAYRAKKKLEQSKQ